MMGAVNNLRSQVNVFNECNIMFEWTKMQSFFWPTAIQMLYFKKVCRPAIQAFGELYLILGKSMEMDLDKVVVLLLQKAADTNRFLR